MEPCGEVHHMISLNLRMRVRIHSALGQTDLRNQFEDAEGMVEAITDRVSDNGVAVVTSTRALLAFIKVGRGSRMYIRWPMPKE